MKPVVILDSGVGGTTLFAQIRQCMAWLPVVYCADSVAIPYGSLSQDQLYERVSLCLASLATICSPALVIIACNSASVAILERIRKEMEVPVVGVVPAIKTAAEKTQNKTVGLLATQATVNSPYTDALVAAFASGINVIRIGSSRLVEIAEASFFGDAVNRDEVAEILAAFTSLAKPPDHVVLGCTHFPLLRKELSDCAPDITWVDSGQAVARRVLSLIDRNEYRNIESVSYTAITTGAYFYQRGGGSSVVSADQRNVCRKAFRRLGFSIVEPFGSLKKTMIRGAATKNGNGQRYRR